MNEREHRSFETRLLCFRVGSKSFGFWGVAIEWRTGNGISCFVLFFDTICAYVGGAEPKDPIV